VFDDGVLLSTDDFIGQVVVAKEFQTAMSTTEFHYRREELVGHLTR
jgi:hypothetical protein